MLVDTLSSAPLPFGGPIDLPVWAPDSSWLAYSSKTTTGTYTVRRITRSGTGDALVVNGASRPQIAPDGHRIAVSLSIDPGANDALRVYDTTAKTMKTVPNSAGAVSYAWAPGGALYYAKDRKGTVAGTLSVTDKSVTRSTTIVSLPVTDPPSIPGALIPSPDGTKVLFAMTGDDGYSRMQVADSVTKKLKAITTPRYDAYPRSWLLDGTALLYIEGNALGSDPIALYSIHPDGTKRVKIVDTPKL
jgi:Tol biopolymer transport system component